LSRPGYRDLGAGLLLSRHGRRRRRGYRRGRCGLDFGLCLRQCGTPWLG
jgi:hypothetical protein